MTPHPCADCPYRDDDCPTEAPHCAAGLDSLERVGDARCTAAEDRWIFGQHYRREP